MTKRTKTTFLIAVIYFLTFSVIFAYGLYLVRAQGSALDTVRTNIAQDAAKEAAYNSIVQIAETSESNRVELEKYFITEKDTISFIANLESVAAGIGVTFDPTELSTPDPVSVAGATSFSTLVMGYKFTGNEASVKKFLTILENIPYHAEIPSISLSNQSQNGEWVGVGQLILTLKP